jgi:hypothetical protein
MSDPELAGKALADKLREQQGDIDKMAYALALLVNAESARHVSADARRINLWIDDAIAILEADSAPLHKRK